MNYKSKYTGRTVRVIEKTDTHVTFKYHKGNECEMTQNDFNNNFKRS